MTKKKVVVEAEASEPSEQNEEESNEEPVKEQVKPKRGKAEKTVQCPNCSKTMLEKTFKYYHGLKCKPQGEVDAQSPALKNVVDFDYVRKVDPSRPSGRYTGLFSRAV